MCVQCWLSNVSARTVHRGGGGVHVFIHLRGLRGAWCERRPSVSRECVRALGVGASLLRRGALILRALGVGASLLRRGPLIFRGACPRCGLLVGNHFVVTPATALAPGDHAPRARRRRACMCVCMCVCSCSGFAIFTRSPGCVFVRVCLRVCMWAGRRQHVGGGCHTGQHSNSQIHSDPGVLQPHTQEPSNRLQC